MRITTDASIPPASFRVCWVEKDLGAGATYRFGFDVKTMSTDMVDNVNVARLELDMPDDAAVPQKFVIPANTIIPAGG